MSDGEAAVIAAAIEWRKHCVIAAPPKHRPPTYSTILAAAVDALRRERHEPAIDRKVPAI